MILLLIIQSGQFYNPTSKTGVLLPDFPKIKDLSFGKPLPNDKVSQTVYIATVMGFVRHKVIIGRC